MSAPPRQGGAARVLAALQAQGCEAEIREFPVGTRTSAEAAAAIGCGVAQIAKSLVFRAAVSGRPVLVIASGSNRVDEGRLAELLGEPVARADAAFVRETTGFAIGGVAPLGHRVPPVTFLDADLQDHAEIWAAAGTPNAVFRLDPAELPRLTGAAFVAGKPD